MTWDYQLVALTWLIQYCAFPELVAGQVDDRAIPSRIHATPAQGLARYPHWPLAVLMFALGAVHAPAQTPEEFYKGRILTLIIGSGAGPSYDVYGRMLARRHQVYRPIGLLSCATPSRPQ